MIIDLQCHRWFGWQRLTRRDLPGFALTPFNQWTYRNTVQWSCRGTGTYTYRVEMWGYRSGRLLVHKIGPTYRTSC